MVTDPSLVDAASVAEGLGVDPARGLELAEVLKRRARHGANELGAEEAVPAWKKLVEQSRDPLTYLLLGAVVVSLVAWVIEGAHGWLHGRLAIPAQVAEMF